MNLARLFVLHAFVTFAAGVVLVVAPGLIPSTVGIELPPNAALLAYLLAGMELGVAVLSFESRKVTDPAALRAIVTAFVVLHASTGVFELLAIRGGVTAKLLLNVLARVVICAAFIFFYRRRARA